MMMIAMISSAVRAAAVAAAVALAGVTAVTAVAAAGAPGASQPQRRQMAVATLTDFRVVLTATRGGPGHRLQATVTAAGFRRSGTGWKLLAVRRVGAVNGWFWFSVEPCSLTATQLANNVKPSPPVIVFHSMKVSLLVTPAIGCSRTFSARWRP